MATLRTITLTIAEDDPVQVILDIGGKRTILAYAHAGVPVQAAAPKLATETVDEPAAEEPEVAPPDRAAGDARLAAKLKENLEAKLTEADTRWLSASMAEADAMLLAEYEQLARGEQVMHPDNEEARKLRRNTVQRSRDRYLRGAARELKRVKQELVDAAVQGSTSVSVHVSPKTGNGIAQRPQIRKAN